MFVFLVVMPLLARRVFVSSDKFVSAQIFVSTLSQYAGVGQSRPQLAHQTIELKHMPYMPAH